MTAHTDSNSPALEKLRQHQQRMSNSQARTQVLESKINAFSATANSETAASQRLAQLEGKRLMLLGSVAMGEADSSELDDLDRELEAAQTDARRSRRNGEIAEAGAARLRAQHEQLAIEASAEACAGDSLRYEAGLELIREALPGYRLALDSLAEAHARLFGRCRAADLFSNLRATPIRYLTTSQTPQMRFDAMLPTLADIDPKDWVFDAGSACDAATSAALALIAG
jgi:hypothetical protein